MADITKGDLTSWQILFPNDFAFFVKTASELQAAVFETPRHPVKDSKSVSVRLHDIFDH